HTPWAGAGHYVIYMKQAIAPVAECRNDFDICAELARRLGIDDYSDKSEEQWLRELTRDTIDDFETFRARGLARLPVPDDAVAFARETRPAPPPPPDPPRERRTVLRGGARGHPPPPPPPGPPPPSRRGIRAAHARRYPLRLLTPKSRARTHSIHDNQAILKRADHDDVWINTTDAAARGIANGQPVRVFNERGATTLPARVTDRVAPGVVSIKEG